MRQGMLSTGRDAFHNDEELIYQFTDRNLGFTLEGGVYEVPNARVIVFATSFLDQLDSHIAGKQNGAGLLAGLAGADSAALEIDYRCDRDPRQALAPDELHGATAVIADLERYDRDLLAAVGRAGGGSLELLVRYGVGMDSVDVAAATEAGVLVANTPGANTVPTAEWAVATLLDVAGRRMHHHRLASRGEGKTGPSRRDVSRRTLGIVGTGAIGRTVVELLRGFAMEVIAHDPYPQLAWAERAGVTYVDLDELLRRSDFITLHAAANQQLIGAAELALMKPTAVLVNCARGVLVDNRAAYSALSKQTLWGYGLDEVWPYRQLAVDAVNLAVSPHIGSDTDDGKANMQLLSAQAVVDYFAGTMPRFAINPEVAGRAAQQQR